MIQAGIDSILPRSQAQTAADVGANRAKAGASVEDAQSTNPILAAQGKAAEYDAVVQMLNAAQNNKQATADPAMGTAAGAAYNKGLAEHAQTVAQTQGQRVGNTLASAGIPFVGPRMESEIASNNAQTAASINEQNRVKEILPFQKQLIQAQMDQMGQEGSRPIPVGGNAVLMPYIDEAGNKQWKVNIPAMQMFQQGGQANPNGSTGVDKPAPIDVNILREIQAGRGR